MEKYCYTSTNNKKNERREVERNWFYRCQKECIPFICLDQRTTRTDIHIDGITYSPELDQMFLSEEPESLHARIKTLFERVRNDCEDCKMTWHGGGLVICLDDVPNHAAESTANALYDLIFDHCARWAVAHGVTSLSVYA